MNLVIAAGFAFVAIGDAFEGFHWWEVAIQGGVATAFVVRWFQLRRRL